MKLPFDILKSTYTKPKLFLCDSIKNKIGEIEVSDLKGSFKFNALQEISFKISKTEQNEKSIYNKIDALMNLFLEGFGYFIIKDNKIETDGIQESKYITAYSREYMLTQKYINGIKINTGEIDSLEVIEANGGDIIPIVFFNENNPKLSLLNIILDKAYGWTIGHVDLSLKKMSRSFSIDRISIYDFIINELCNKFNCYTIFDTINNTINFYEEARTANFVSDGNNKSFVLDPIFADIGEVRVNGYQITGWNYNNLTGELYITSDLEPGAYIEVKDGSDVGNQTDVFISFDNLAKNIEVQYNADDIKTMLKVTYDDNKDIRDANLGQEYLIDLSYYNNLNWMGQELFEAYNQYLSKINSLKPDYEKNSKSMLKYANYIDFEENRLSLTYSIATVSSETVGVYYVRGGEAPNYFYAKVTLPDEYIAGTIYYSLNTANLNEEKVGNLYSALKKYFHQEADWEEDMNSLAEEFKFMQEYTIQYLIDGLKTASTNEEKDIIVYNFLGEMWNEIGKNPLKIIYYENYKTIQVLNIDAGWSEPSNENYGLYYPVTLFINSIETAIKSRDIKIAAYQDQYNLYAKKNQDISNSIKFENNFTQEDLSKLDTFLREDEVNFSDIVETKNDTINKTFENKKKAIDNGYIELRKISKPKLQFNLSMNNIFAIKEFEGIISQFQLGKIIKIAIRDNYIKQARLLGVDINFEDFTDFNCEFGELTEIETQSSLHADLLSQAVSAGKTVASNSDYWTVGTEIANSTEQKITQGLLDAVTEIKSIDGTQDAVIDKYGIRLQKKNENQEINPEAVWFVNNKIIFTDDNFKTCKSALGKISVDGKTYYGLISEIVLSGYIEGSVIKGGEIHIGDRGDGTYNFEVDSNGNVSMKSGTIDGYTTSEDFSVALGDIEDLKKQIDGQIESYFYDYVPTNDNKPASEWISENDKVKHLGDIFYVTGDGPDAGQSYRWIVENGNYKWMRISDSEAAQALELAKKAQLTAEGKMRVFVDIPYPPYNVGDLWSQGASGELMRCKFERLEGLYDPNDWEPATDTGKNYSELIKTNEKLSSKITSVETSFNNISVGGSNLLNNTNQGTKNWGYSSNNGSFDIYPAQDNTGIEYVEIICWSTADEYSVLYFEMSSMLKLLEQETEYMISFDFRSNVNTVLNFAIMDLGWKNFLTDPTSFSSTEQIGGDVNRWYHVSIPIKTIKYDPSIVQNQVLYITGLNHVGGVGIEGRYYIKNLQLEKGNLSTNWKPSNYETEEHFSLIEQTSKDISATVGKKLSKSNDTKSFGWTLTDENWEIRANSDTIFNVNKNGAYVKGTIEAQSGHIGNLRVTNEALLENGELRGGYIAVEGDDHATYIGPPNDSMFGKYVIMTGDGKSDESKYKFKVEKDGTLHATGAIISGDIEVTSGSISLNNGKWEGNSKNGVYLGKEGIVIGGDNFRVNENGELHSAVTDELNNQMTSINTEIGKISSTVYSTEIGGGNILNGTNQGLKNWNIGYNNGSFDLLEVNDKNGKYIEVKCWAAASEYHALFYNDGWIAKELKPNSTYVVSFDLYSNVTANWAVSVRRFNWSGELTDDGYAEQVGGDNKWHKISFVIKTNDLAETIDSQGLYITGFNSVAGVGVPGEYYIKNLQMELGNTASAWSPSKVSSSSQSNGFEWTMDADSWDVNSIVGNEKTNIFSLSKDGAYLKGKMEIDAGYVSLNGGNWQTGSEQGVYLGPEGINIGENKFYVSNKGNVTITAGSISLNGGAWETDQTSETGIYLGTDGIQIGKNFRVDNKGNLTANSGTFGGTIYANQIQAGEVGGYIVEDQLDGGVTDKINSAYDWMNDFIAGRNVVVTNLTVSSTMSFKGKNVKWEIVNGRNCLVEDTSGNNEVSEKSEVIKKDNKNLKLEEKQNGEELS